MHLSLPISRTAQHARIIIIRAVKDYKDKIITLDDFLIIFYTQCNNDPILLDSFYYVEITNMMNKEQNFVSKNFIILLDGLQTLPLANEVDDPYALCKTNKEKIDREIVLKLIKFWPESLDKDYFKSHLELDTCAHLCFTSLANTLNQFIMKSTEQHLKPNNISFLSKSFNFIEQLAKMKNSYVDNVIAVSFLEDLTDFKKDKWRRLLGPNTNLILRNLEIHLFKMYS